MEKERERLNIADSGRQKKGTPSLRYHVGKPPRPVAVGCRLSRMLNTCLSLIYLRPVLMTVLNNHSKLMFQNSNHYQYDL